ncbi:MAG: histidine phosphotransferase family protein [Sphingomonadales bacterium]
MTEKDFTAMVCSKILHDLAGPIGAVMNGTELLKETSNAGNEEIIELLQSSSDQLTALLQVFRVSFGALSSGGDEVEAGMVQTHLETYTNFKGVRMTWQPEEAMINKGIAKMLVNGIFLLTELARKKGQLQVSSTNTGGNETFSIAAFGQGITAPEELKAIFNGTKKPEMDTRNIPAFIIIGLAKEKNMSVTLVETPNGVVLQGQSNLD